MKFTYSTFRAAFYVVVGAVCGMVSAVPGTAFASPYEMYGAGVQESAMSATLTQASDYGAVYYNPAALPDVDPMISIGGFATLSSGGIILKKRPKGYDIPDFGSSVSPLPTKQQINQRLHTPGPKSIYALTFGGVHNLGLKNFRVAASVFIPLNPMMRLSTHFSDERERFFSNQLSWELIDQRVSRLDIEAGVGYRVLDWLSLGVAGSYLPGAVANVMAYVQDPADPAGVMLKSEVEPVSGWGISAGVVFYLPWQLQVALAGRTAIDFEINAVNQMQVRGVSEKGDIRTSINWRPLYTPPSISAGVSWVTDTFTVELDGRFTRWDDYLDTVREKANFHNVFSAELGAKYNLNESTAFMIGTGYTPTPVPDQTGRTNYVDNSRFKLTLGGTHEFDIADFPLKIGWAGQLHILVPRDTDKAILDNYPNCSENQIDKLCDDLPDNTTDPNTGAKYPGAKGLQTGNPGFPGFASGGMIAGLKVEVHL